MAEPSVGLREAKKRETREHIARVGVALFVERGFDAVSVADIAQQARVSKVTVFNYFPAKEDIFLFSAARGVPDFAAVVEGARSDVEVVQAVWDYARRAFAARAEWSGLHENNETYARVIDESSVLTRAMHDTWARLRSDFVCTIAGRVAQGADMEPDIAMRRVLAAQIIAAVEELTTLNRKLTQTKNGTREILEESLQLVDRAFHRILRSVAPNSTPPL